MRISFNWITRLLPIRLIQSLSFTENGVWIFCHFAYIFELTIFVCRPLIFSYFPCCPFTFHILNWKYLGIASHHMRGTWFIISYMFEKRKPHEFQNLPGTIIFNKILFLLKKTNMSRDSFCDLPHSLYFWEIVSISSNYSLLIHRSLSLTLNVYQRTERIHNLIAYTYISVNCSPYPILFFYATLHILYNIHCHFCIMADSSTLFSYFLICIRSTFISTISMIRYSIFNLLSSSLSVSSWTVTQNVFRFFQFFAKACDASCVGYWIYCWLIELLQIKSYHAATRCFSEKFSPKYVDFVLFRFLFII